MSYLQVQDEPKTAMFVITSVYMAVSAVFLSFYMITDTERRFAVFKNGYIIGAVIASVIGLVGYFNIGGTGSYLSPIFRAQGTFKDPNVLSTYLILPAVLMTQDVMLGTKKWQWLRYAGLGLVVACLFLAFSRGAWVNFAGSVMLMVIFTFTLTPSSQLRTRILLLAIGGLILMAVMLAGLLSIDTVKAAFADRATLAKDYDSGEFGRFGNQMNSIPMLLERPFGFGPPRIRQDLRARSAQRLYQCLWILWLARRHHLHAADHQHADVGFKGLLMRTPWQGASIVLFVTFFCTAMQGVQIDTDHLASLLLDAGIDLGALCRVGELSCPPQCGASRGKEWSERQDSNLRPLTPQISALPGCATLRLGAACSIDLRDAEDLFGAGAVKADGGEDVAAIAGITLCLQPEDPRPRGFGKDHGNRHAEQARAGVRSMAATTSSMTEKMQALTLRV
jgi:hypothetical protein